MLEKGLRGSRKYWLAVAILSLVTLGGLLAYLRQYELGLTVTGMSRDVPWGFYISQFTFLVGVAASAVMVVLPYYLYDYKAFGKVTVLGEFLAVAAVTMCMLFVFVDMGKPTRVMNILLHPTPNSLMFWDFMALGGYLCLNVLITQVTLGAERKGVAPPSWIRPIIFLSIPWAVSIHTVTAFLYSGLAARGFWMTAILAPRFLASAFASGPSLLILLCLVVRRVSKFDPVRRPFKNWRRSSRTLWPSTYSSLPLSSLPRSTATFRSTSSTLGTSSSVWRGSLSWFPGSGPLRFWRWDAWFSC